MTRREEIEHERQVAEILRTNGLGSVSTPDAKSKGSRARVERETRLWNEDAGASYLSAPPVPRAFDEADAKFGVTLPKDCCFDDLEEAEGDRGDRLAVSAISRVALELGRWAGRKDQVKAYAAEVALHLEKSSPTEAARRFGVTANFVRARVREAREMIISGTALTAHQ